MLWLLVLGLVGVVVWLVVRLLALQKQLDWHRRHVHDIADRRGTVERQVALQLRPDEPEVEPQPVPPQPEPRPVVTPPRPPLPPARLESE